MIAHFNLLYTIFTVPHHRHRGALPARKYDLHKWLKPVYPSRNERLLVGIQKE
jgi:hypothetical protein